VTTDSHQRIARRQSLTPRQEEVLALIGQGCTNGEIAERLGITLDGAKWHVSEIIAKLGVDSREEAVEAWRAEQSLGRRLVRAARALLAPILVHKIVVAGVAGAIVLLAGGAIVLATHGSGGNTASVANPLRDLPRSPTWGQVVDHPVFTGYQMFDSKVGWAQATDGNRIILTEDGGRTWRDVSPALPGGTTPIQHSLSFLDDNHAWVLAHQRLGTTSDLKARVYWTTDRGGTWHESDSLIAMDQMAAEPAVTFLDPDHGWILSLPALLYRTTDGGRTWQTVPVQFGTIDGDPPGSLPKSCATNLNFVTASRGFAYGRCGPATLPYIFRTNDAGATWQRVDLPGAGVGQYGSALSFPTSNDGFIILFASADRAAVSGIPPAAGSVYATHDSGLTWVLAGHVLGTRSGGKFNTVQFVDPLHGWLMGQPVSERTTDGGQTWEAFPDDSPFPTAEFVSPEEGFAWTGGGQTYSPGDAVPPLSHTLDGGKTWQPVQP